MNITEDNIYQEAELGNLEILNSPFVDKITNPSYKKTPLYYLTRNLLAHFNGSYNQALMSGSPGDFYLIGQKLKNLRRGLEKKYPWFTFEGEITLSLINQIISTSNAEKFIRENK